MQIDFVSENLKWFWSPKQLDQFLGGTQAWMLELARALKRRGHSVTIWKNGPDEEWEGIAFRDRKFYDGKSEITISWNSEKDIFSVAPKYERLFMWSNSPTLPKLERDEYKQVERFISISGYQAHSWINAIDIADVPIQEIVSIYPGVDPEEFDPQGYVERNPNLAIYSSSWDRGLRNLIGFWPALKRKAPNLELVVTYSRSFMDEISGAWDPIPFEWRDLGIRFEEKDRLGMGRLYREASYMLYPCTGTEMFCLSSWKAQSQGCLVINSNEGALVETTIRGMAVPMASWLQEASWWLVHPEYGDSLRRKEMIDLASWDECAQQWETLFAGNTIKSVQ